VQVAGSKVGDFWAEIVVVIGQEIALRFWENLICVTAIELSKDILSDGSLYLGRNFREPAEIPAPGLRVSLNRYLLAALLSLPCLSTLPALAQSSASTQPFVTLSVGANPTAGGVSLTGTVQPDTPGSVPHPSGTVTFLDGTTVLNASGTVLTANPSASAQTFVQVFGTPDPCNGSSRLGRARG
jgi:hypothetical protein